jgi:hypothetical protein
MSRQHGLRFDALDPVFPHLEPLGEVPEEEVDKHAAHRAAVRAQGRSDALHGDDRRSADRDLLPCAARELLAGLERTDEWRCVGEQPEVVEHLRHPVVREHGELSDSAGKEWVWIRV